MFVLLKQNEKAGTKIDEKMIESEIIMEIGKSIHEAGYIFGLDYSIISDEEIMIEIKLPEEITDDIQQHITGIAEQIITEKDYHPESFHITVSNFTSSN